MKKVWTLAVVLGIIATLSVGAYARGRGGMRGGMRQGGQRPCGGQGMMQRGQGRGPGMQQHPCWNATTDAQGAPVICPLRDGQPGQPGSAAKTDMLTDEKAQQVAEEYVTKYLTGYTVEKVEKDSWRPIFFATVKGPNDAVQQLWIHGFGGQVMHVVPVN